MPNLYIDESGFSGSQYLDLAQPVYSVAAVLLEEEEAILLKDKYFGKYRGPELKYKNLKKDSRHIESATKLLKELIDRNAVFLSASYKRYVAVAKMFDLILEPLIHSLGEDAYKEGGIVEIAGTVWSVLEHHYPEKLDETIEAFRNLVIKKDEVSRQALIQVLSSFPESTESFIQLILYPLMFLDLSLLDIDSAEDASGIVSTTGLWIIFAAKDIYRSSFNVIYDQSKVIEKESPLWNWYLSADAKPFEYKAENLTVTFPIDVTTTLGDSKNFVGLQLADVMAGLINQIASDFWLSKTSTPELEAARQVILNSPNAEQLVNFMYYNGNPRKNGNYQGLLEYSASSREEFDNSRFNSSKT